MEEDNLSSFAPSDITGMTKIANVHSMPFGIRKQSIGRADSPTGSLRTYNGTSFGPLFDWSYSPVMEDILNNKPMFN
jgi:hypothetical protein